MTEEKKKIVIWCGNAANQRALASKIAAQFHLCGIVVDKKSRSKKTALPERIKNFIHNRIFFRSIVNAWNYIQNRYGQQYPQWPEAPFILVDSINSDEAFSFTQKLAPDLVVVSGTALVRTKMLSLAPAIGIVNLHTGLSPYIKGGPNCTNWCISTAQYEKIGNSIMWINEGIDAGNLITTECTPLQDIKNLSDLHWQVMEHAHDLYIRAIHYLLDTPVPHQSVPQKEIATGKLYLTRMWDFTAKKKFLANWPGFLKKKTMNHEDAIVTVPLKKYNAS